jgi:hypothetical protein
MNKDKLYQDGYTAGQDDMYTKMQEQYRTEKYLTEDDVQKIVNNWKEANKRNEETIKILAGRPTLISLNEKNWIWLDDNDLRKVYKEWIDDGIESDKELSHFALMIQTALVNKNEIKND